jgi:DNA primase
MSASTQKIKDIDLGNLVESTGTELRHCGNRFVGLCPIHGEDNPSFYVFQDNHFKCFGCGEYGDAVDFLRLLYGYDFLEALRHLGIDGNLTAKQRREIEKKKEIETERVQRERDLVFTLATLIRSIRKRMADMTPKQFKEYGEIMDPLPAYEYYHDVLARGSKEEKKEIVEGLKNMPTITDITFNELADWYLNLEKTKKPKAYSAVYCRVQNFNQVYGPRYLVDIKLEDLENYKEIRSRQDIKNTTIDNEMVQVKTVIIKAWKNDMVSGKILKAFKSIEGRATKEERSRDRVLTLAEYLSLIENALKQERCKMIFAMHTGMRPGEIKGLQWGFIDRKAGFIQLPADYTKEKAKRIIPINHHVQDALDELGNVRHITHVFPYGGRKPCKYRGPSPAFKTACEKAKVPCGKKEPNGIIPHDFRRTFKTNCVSAGVDPAWRNALLGHSQEGMDNHYIKPSKEDLQKAMDKYTGWFDGEVAESSDQTSDQAI